MPGPEQKNPTPDPIHERLIERGGQELEKLIAEINRVEGKQTADAFRKALGETPREYFRAANKGLFYNEQKVQAIEALHELTAGYREQNNTPTRQAMKVILSSRNPKAQLTNALSGSVAYFTEEVIAGNETKSTQQRAQEYWKQKPRVATADIDLYADKPPPPLKQNILEPKSLKWARYEALLASVGHPNFPENGAMAVVSVSGGKYVKVCATDDHINPPLEKKRLGKFHLSVDSKDIPKAWDLIADRLVKEGLSAKAITPKGLEHINNNLTGARGKDIVIYFNRDDIRDTGRWKTLLNDIEKIYAENGIRPGPDVTGDRKVPGSRYAHLEHGDGKYDNKGHIVSKWDDGLHGKPDPFEKLNVTPQPMKEAQVKPPPLQPNTVEPRVEKKPRIFGNNMEPPAVPLAGQGNTGAKPEIDLGEKKGKGRFVRVFTNGMNEGEINALKEKLGKGYIIRQGTDYRESSPTHDQKVTVIDGPAHPTKQAAVDDFVKAEKVVKAPIEKQQLPPLPQAKGPPPLPDANRRRPRIFNADDGPAFGKRNLTGMDSRPIGSVDKFGDVKLNPNMERRLAKQFPLTMPDKGTPTANPKIAPVGDNKTPPNVPPEQDSPVISKTSPNKPTIRQTIKSVLLKPMERFNNPNSNRNLGIASLVFGVNRAYEGITKGDTEQAVLGSIQTGAGTAGLFSKSSKLVKGAGIVGIGVMTYDSAKQIYTADTTEKKVEAGVDTGIVLWSNIKTGGMAGTAGVTVKNEWKAYTSGDKSVSVGNVTKSVIYTGLDTTIGQLGKLGGAKIVSMFGGKGEDLSAVIQETDAIYAREAKRFQAREDFATVRSKQSMIGSDLDLTKNADARIFRKRLKSKLDDAKERMQDNKHYMVVPSATRDAYNDAKSDVAIYRAALRELKNGYVEEYRRIEKIRAGNNKLRAQRRESVKEQFGDTVAAVASQQLDIDQSGIEVEVLTKNKDCSYELDVITLKISGDKGKDPAALVKQLNKKLDLGSPQATEAIAYLQQHGLLEKHFNLKRIAFNVDTAEGRESRVSISSKDMQQIALISQAAREVVQQKQYANAIVGNALGIDAKTASFETLVKHKHGHKPSVVYTLKVKDEEAFNRALQEKLGISKDDVTKLIDDPAALAVTINDKLLLLNSPQTAKAVEYMKDPDNGIKVSKNFDVRKVGFSITGDEQGHKVLAINSRRLTEIDRLARAGQKVAEKDAKVSAEPDKQLSQTSKDDKSLTDKAMQQARDLLTTTSVQHIEGEYDQNDIQLQPTGSNGKTPDELDIC